MEELKKRLEACGVRPTYQRLKILGLICANMEHPTADMIYNLAKKDMPTISKTTVYNTVNMFLSKGLIAGVAITGTELRFDHETCGHHHFLCISCGKILNIMVNCPVFKNREFKGNEITEFHGYLKGLCRNCKTTRKRGQK